MKNESNIKMLPIEKLKPHPKNPRTDIGDIGELAASIKVSGILQNLTVVEHEGEYRVIIGHRRLAAAKSAGLKELPCVVVEMSEKEQIATMVAENMQRRDLTISQQVKGVQMLLDLGESLDGVSKATGLSKSTVRQRQQISSLGKSFRRCESQRRDRRTARSRFKHKKSRSAKQTVKRGRGKRFRMEAQKKH